MKKVLSFIILMVCAVTAWAQATIDNNLNWPNANVIKVTTTEAGQITSTVVSDIVSQSGGKLILAIEGPVNQDDIDAITAGVTSGSIQVIDYGKATGLSGLSITTPTQAHGLRLPVSEDLTKNYGSNLQYVMSSGMTAIRSWSGDESSGSDHINLHITDQAGVSSFISDYGGNPSWIQFRHINLSTTVDNLDYSELSSKVSSGFTINPADNTGEEYVMPISECTECTINKDSENKVATVHTVHPGHFKALFKQEFNYNDYKGWTFKFDSDCNLNEADLLTLVGDETYQSNEFYVDLFDVPATDALCNWQTGLITNVINEIRSKNESITDPNNCYQFRGLILPKDHTIYGSGTTMIQGIHRGAEGDIATCSEFIVYYKTKDENQLDVDNKLLVAHIYNVVSNGSVENYQAAYNKMKVLLDAHTEVAQDADIYQISSNFQLRSSDGSYEKINISTLPEGKAIVETYNNEMVGASTVANMISHPVEGGDFATSATATGIINTPTEKLTIVGPMSEADFTAIKDFATRGPRILDLRGVTLAEGETFDKMLAKINNSKIEYVVLPENTEKDVIFADYKKEGNMSGLKAVINAASSHTSQPNIVANIYEAGSLYEARIHALDLAKGDGNKYHLYGKYGVQSVTLKGTLNAADIAAQVTNRPETQNGDAVPIYIDADGHWSDVASDNPANFGLGNEQGTLTYFDLEEAVFVPQSDMNFWKAGYEKLTTVILPTTGGENGMNTIPKNCFNNIATLKNLCVPYNYEYIEDGAFWLTGIDHMTTTDAAGAEVDNGPKSWTISANVKELGTRPSENYNGEFVATVFPMNVGVQDIYCLAVKVPKCYANVFPDNACYGWGGDDSTMPYSRDRYFNGGDPDEAWAVLHFPSKESWEKSAGTKETSYETLKQLYTDVNKEFTKKEQTGAVDANGDPIAWPTHYEGYRSYNQASLGLTWNDWNVQRDPTIEGHINDGGGIAQNTPVGSLYLLNPTGVSEGSKEGDYDFEEYMGWHQIVLSLATYVEPDEKIENEKIVREYEDAGWFTFCIPFNMTYDQVVEMLGVPKSTDKVINKLNGKVVEDEDIMPDIRQLSGVTRKKGTGNNNNIVFLRLTRNLYDKSTGHTNYLEFNNAAIPQTITPSDAQPYNQSYTMGTQRCLVGGRPYVIKAYKRVKINDKGEDEYKIKGQNIAKAILTRYADQFGADASCVMNGLYEQLGDGDLLTLRFAKPYEEHKVQAVRDGENSAYLTYEVDNDGNVKTYKYYYTMIGQFWQQPLPQYCLYMSRGNWYRYTNTKLNYTWDPYKCVILATQEVDNGKGGKFRDEAASVYPEVQEGTTDKLNETFSLTFLDGRDDDDFDGNGTSSRYIFGLDDDIIEFDEDGNEVTAIERLDGEDIVPAGSKVYNVAGQYVGESLNGLTKGLYIVNGKKIVVK